ncbi:UNVERIFIED_CONTAM: hypothetical protein Sradi_6955700 [Sesamum radiatum]|uniref:Uncharacterized protein n=1 Tax=Sesamum radiatum TaxID=300843 RepID=A0AAW2JFJ2_SESRA
MKGASGSIGTMRSMVLSVGGRKSSIRGCRGRTSNLVLPPELVGLGVEILNPVLSAGVGLEIFVLLSGRGLAFPFCVRSQEDSLGETFGPRAAWIRQTGIRPKDMCSQSV